MAAHAAKGTVEKKVTWATVGTVLSSAIVAGLNASVGNEQLLGSLPGWAQSLLIVVGPSLVTFLGGWAAPHTPRTDLEGTVVSKET